VEALLQGDLSGAVLSRAFVCGAHVLGMISSASLDYSPAMVHFHARRVQSAWESLAELFRSKDYRTCLHAAVLVVSSHVYMRMPQMALLYIQKCSEFIEKGGIQFIPTFGRPPKFTEDLHEILAALSQTIYWANYLFLTCGGPEPCATAQLEIQFRQDLPVSRIISISSAKLIPPALALLSNPFPRLSVDDTDTGYTACQGYGDSPQPPPCRR
jgi:hypothetical protein